MASITAEPNAVKSSRCPNPSKKVGVIGRIRGLTDKEFENRSVDSKSWITIRKHKEDVSSQKSTVFLESQSSSRKDGYELDCCYEQHEEISHIYSREVQPMVSQVFNGQNASVIALGARGSGKTYTIQGTQEKPGLAVIAMSELLSKAKELGKSVSISVYELTQEHVKDLLNPDHPTIQLLEDAHGKINIKGLSQVPVRTMSEFHNIYSSQGNLQNTQKSTTDQPRNKGLMVHISYEDDKPKAKLANKINFVDLAGYEDPRKSSRDGGSNRSNKLLYSLLNVVNAINTNESRVPYRESKLTRILQDSLGGTSNAVLITCLNPCFCQDSLSFVSLLSRTCRSVKQVLTDSTNRSQSSTKVKLIPSSESGKQSSASLSVKKQIGHNRPLSAKKASSIVKGRKLYDEVQRVNDNQLRCQSEDISVQQPKTVPSLALAIAPFSLEEDRSPESGHTQSNISNAKVPTHFEAVSTGEESNHSHRKNDGSPPLSERIRAISDNLKSLCASTPSKINMPQELVSQDECYEIAEPKTPAIKLNIAKYCSPRGTFSNRSSGIKHSIVHEYLNFLNSANKEELKSLKGIGEKRATYILDLREESPEPFKNLDDLQGIGLSAKQIKGMMKQVAGDIFS